jgi:large subunit ribosomal protein L21
VTSYAIVCAAGKQHRVEKGEHLTLDRQLGEVGTEITWDKVLLLCADATPTIGQPYVAGAQVVARILKHRRGAKIKVFKRRKRKGFHKMIGHRQELTELEIVNIGD